MEPSGPVVSSDQIPDSLNPPIQNLKVPVVTTEEKAPIAHKGETKMPDPGVLPFFVSTFSLRHKNSN